MGFSIATWNILAEKYVVRSRYEHCTPKALDRAARRQLLLDRVAALNVDVLLLQEVEPDAHEAIARRLGQSGLYAQRPGRPDGESVFTRLPVKGHEVLRYATHDQLALIVELEEAVVASTHLQWSKDDSIAQTQLLELLNRVDARPWIIGGDFNVTPDSVALTEAFRRGFVESSTAVTCNANEKPRKLDYLLAKGLTLTASEPRSLAASDALPSESEPSDHLPLESTVTVAGV